MNFGSMESCCGIGELSGLAEPDQVLVGIFKYDVDYADYDDDGNLLEYRPRIVVFTDNDERHYGEKLAALIKEKKLGTVKFSGFVENTNLNHDSKVAIWIWKPKWDKVWAYTETTKAYKNWKKTGLNGIW